jgi:hypothetical protein
VRAGVGWGIALATCFSAFVLLMALLRGSSRYPDGLTTWHVLAFYYAAASSAAPSSACCVLGSTAT